VATTFAAKATNGDVLFKNANGYDINTVAADGTIFTLVDGVTAVAAGKNITLDAGGAVTQTAGKDVTTTATGRSGVEGGGAYTLTNVTNNVGTIAASTTNTISYRDADDLVVGTVNTTGISSGGNDITLQTGGTLTINQSVSAGVGNLTLNSAGAVTQASGKTVTAAGLELKGAGTFT